MTIATMQAVAGGIAAAILGLAILTGSSGGLLFAFFTALPILWVALQHGIRPGLIAAGISLAVQIVMLGPIAVVGQGLASAVPAALLGGIAARQGLGTALGALTAWFLALFAFLLLATAGAEGGLQGLSREIVPLMLGDMAAVSGGPDMSVLLGLVEILPGLTAVSLTIVLLGNLALARRLIGGMARPRLGFATVRLPGWIVDGVVVAALLSLTGGVTGYIGGNALMILGMAPLVVGLSVAHRVCNAGFGGMPLLVVLYLMLAMLPPFAVAVAGLGLIDHWVGIRRRLPAASPTKED